MLKAISFILFIVIIAVCGLIYFSHVAQQQAYDFCNELYSGFLMSETKLLAKESGMELQENQSSEQLSVYYKTSPIAFWQQHACLVTHDAEQVLSLELATF